MVQFIDETVDDLTALMEEDFGPLDRTKEFNHCVLDWFHYRARLIPMRQREVILSSEVKIPVRAGIRLQADQLVLYCKNHNLDLFPSLHLQ